MKLFKSFSLILQLPISLFKVSQIPKPNLLDHWIFVKVFRMSLFILAYKAIFLRKLENPWNSSKTFFLYWSLFISLYLQSFKMLNWLSCAMEYFFKAWECQILLTNAKPFFRKERETLELFKNFLPKLELLIKFFWSLWKAYVESSRPWNIFWDSKTNLGTLQTLFPY